MRTIVAVLRDPPSVVVDLEKRTKSDLDLEFSLVTDNNSFINKTFMQAFQGRPKRFKATVKSFELDDSGSSVTARFSIFYRNDRTTIKMSKAELVGHLTDESDPRLTEDTRWDLRSRLNLFRFVSFTHFMHNVHELLTILSKSFQSNSLVVLDISKIVNKTVLGLAKLKDGCGQHEKEFWVEVRKDDEADTFRTCQLFNGDTGRDLFKSDRLQVIDGLTAHLTERFTKVLDNPIIQATVSVDHSSWPSSQSLLEMLTTTTSQRSTTRSRTSTRRTRRSTWCSTSGTS